MDFAVAFAEEARYNIGKFYWGGGFSPHSERKVWGMSDYVAVVKGDESVSVCFYIEEDKILTIGEKMNDICEDAYMNGYNWEAFLNYYLEKNAPDVLEEMETDPEAGMYAAYYPATPENEARAEKFAEIIRSLVEEEEELYRIVEENGDEIEWD